MNAALERKLGQYATALERLREALAVPESAPLAVDGTIQRFEFTFELAWKTMKAFLDAEGQSVAESLMPVLRAAYAARLIDDETSWLRMLKSRNQAEHIYNEAMAQEIYHSTMDCMPVLAAALERLRERAASL